MTQPNTVELHITSNTRCLPVVRSAVEKMAKMEGFGDVDAHALTLAIDEALANVIKHAYNGQPDQPIIVSFKPTHAADGRSGIIVEVRDHGRQVDPSTIRSRDLDDVRQGGLGVHIIRTLMDECEYLCQPNGGMLLRMVKYAGRRDDKVTSVNK